jgi:putative membrane protein
MPNKKNNTQQQHYSTQQKTDFMKTIKNRNPKMYPIQLLLPKMANLLDTIRTIFLPSMLILALSSCGDNGNGDSKMEANMDTMKARVENKVDEMKEQRQENQDANFVQDAIKANNKELYLLKLGVDKGTSKELKSHAKMMWDDHQKLGEQLNAYAAAHNITVSTDQPTSGLADDKAGTDWDKRWVKDMADEHEKATNDFEAERDKANDPALKDMVVNTIPTLRSHWDMVKGLQDKMK